MTKVSVQVQRDHLQRVAHVRRPLIAVAELIWNGCKGANLNRVALRYLCAAYVITIHACLVIQPELNAQAPAPSAASANAAGGSVVAQFLRTDQLPRYRRSIAKVGSFSSYDRTGGNEDGFSGIYSFLRKEPAGGLVIAELRGPGALTRIWMPGKPPGLPGAPVVCEDTVEFFFDDEPSPRLRLPFKDLFTGTTAPFVAPLSGSGVGGYYSYVPIEFAKSIKVVVRASLFTFYQINYVQYKPGTFVRTFEPGKQIQSPVVIDTTGRSISVQRLLRPGQRVTLFNTTKPGRIVALKMWPADAFAGGERDILIRISWDGAQRPAVEMPVGDFFGYFFGEPAVRSPLVGTEHNWNYIRFPMPFARGARIELASQRRCGRPIPVHAEVVVSDQGKLADEGTFHAAWRREDPVPTGKPFTFLDVHGKGHVVGAMLQAQGMHPGRLPEFFEGDDNAIIDGDTTVHGTGSEDFFNGGWYDLKGRWDHGESFLFSGSLGYQKNLGRTGGYRIFLTDAYAFRRRMTLTMEHGGSGNIASADYTGVTYYYFDRPEGNGGQTLAVEKRMINQLVGRSNSCVEHLAP